MCSLRTQYLRSKSDSELGEWLEYVWDLSCKQNTQQQYRHIISNLSIMIHNSSRGQQTSSFSPLPRCRLVWAFSSPFPSPSSYHHPSSSSLSQAGGHPARLGHAGRRPCRASFWQPSDPGSEEFDTERHTLFKPPFIHLIHEVWHSKMTLTWITQRLHSLNLCLQTNFRALWILDKALILCVLLLYQMITQKGGITQDSSKAVLQMYFYHIPWQGRWSPRRWI